MANVRLRLLDSTVRYESKRVVESLVERLYAEWVIRNVVARMLPETPGLTRLRYYPQVTNSVGATMPAAELPGVKFVLRGRTVYGASAPTRDWLRGARRDLAEMSV